MLEQFFIDWNAAVQSRTVVSETKDIKGVIVTQNTKFRFRDVEIQMFTRLIPGGENLPPEKRRWKSELYVPATNKIINNETYESRAKCAAAILSALVPGWDHEDRVEARQKMREINRRNKIIGEVKERLKATSFNEGDRKFILDWVTKKFDAAHNNWLLNVITIICDHHWYITGVGLKEHNIDLGDEESAHINRMCSTTCGIIQDSFKNRQGKDIVGWSTISRRFLAPKKDIPYGAYVVRSAYSKIYNACCYPNIFMEAVKLIAAYYERRTGIKTEDRIKQMQTYRLYKQQRTFTRKFGTASNSTSNNKIETATENYAPIGVTLGDAFGNILDEIKTEPSASNEKSTAEVSPTPTGRKIKRTRTKKYMPSRPRKKLNAERVNGSTAVADPDAQEELPTDPADVSSEHTEVNE